MTKTAAQKLLSPAGHRPINLGSVSKVPFPDEPPEHLGDSEKEIWVELADQWSEVLTGGDVQRFEKHVILEALYRQAYFEGDIPALLKYHDRLDKGYLVFGATPLARLKFKGEEIPYTAARKGKMSMKNGKVEDNILD